MTAWAVHLMAASVLLAAAARLGESALLTLGRPVRGIWLMALLGAFLLPAATRHASAPAAAETPAPRVAAGAVSLPADRVMSVERQRASLSIPVSASLERAVTVTWLVSSVGVGLGLFALLARLALAGRRWPRRRLDGTEVLVSADEGPAVFGVVRARIVVPAWLLASSPAERSLVLAHEREHAAAGDQRLLALGFLLVCLAPWNPVLWWMLLRLRLAVEVDCDRRVLRANRDVRAYGAMLLCIAGRSNAPALSAAFIEPASFLRRRIVAMTARRPRHAALRGSVLAGLAAGLVVLACEMAPPTELNIAPEEGPAETEVTATASTIPHGEYVAEPDAEAGASKAAEPIEELPVVRMRPAEVRIADPDVPSDTLIWRVAPNVVDEIEVRLRASQPSPPASVPLIYVDGVRVPGDVMRELDPDRIERVEVIKGPAAARIIGANAAGGVIQITTKGGGAR